MIQTTKPKYFVNENTIRESGRQVLRLIIEANGWTDIEPLIRQSTTKMLQDIVVTKMNEYTQGTIPAHNNY